jgi:hypothetical protein
VGAYNHTLKPKIKGPGNWTEFWVAPARTPLGRIIEFDEICTGKRTYERLNPSGAMNLLAIYKLERGPRAAKTPPKREKLKIPKIERMAS